MDDPPASFAYVGGLFTNGVTVIQGSRISDHDAGGVYSTNGQLTIEGSLINYNGKHGVVVVGISSNPTYASVNNSTIENNFAVSMFGDDGEGLAAASYVALSVSNTTISGNGKERIETTSTLAKNLNLL